GRAGAGWHDGPVPRPPSAPWPSRGLSRGFCLLALLLVAVTLLSGCARVRAALAVQPDDTVTGEVVVATPETGPEDRGPQITVPPSIEDEVEVSEYRQDGYTGSVLRFSGLSFDQVAELASALAPAGQEVELELRRAGNRVIVEGTADLTTVPVDRADFQLKIGFPGEVLESTGETDGGTASWTFVPGEVGDIATVVSSPDPEAPSALSWTLGLAAMVALAGAAVVVLAHRTRNPPVTPAR
ncbi:MAG TPA: hypothetical protein VD813_07605, partial [Pseudonocardia sp.]|nr:hypothetical protein [Pseudonocardia sp.]